VTPESQSLQFINTDFKIWEGRIRYQIVTYSNEVDIKSIVVEKVRRKGSRSPPPQEVSHKATLEKILSL
jgi:hypothetical protein